MKRRTDYLTAVLPVRESETTSARDLPDGLLPVLVLLAIGVIRLAAFVWDRSSWGVEESLALAFALGAAYLLAHSVGRSRASRGREAHR